MFKLFMLHTKRRTNEPVDHL